MRIELIGIILENGAEHEIEFSPPIEATDLVIVAGLREPKNPAPVPPTDVWIPRSPAPLKPEQFRKR